MALRDLHTVQKTTSQKQQKNTASIMQEKDASYESSTSHQSCSNYYFISHLKEKKLFFFLREYKELEHSSNFNRVHKQAP